MSLKSFHILFITLSAAVSSLLAVWGFHSEHFFLGMTGLFLLLLLIPYARWFQKKMSKIQFLIFPCVVCFGDPNSLMVHGAKMGVLALFLVIGTVLLSILWIGLTWAKKAKVLSE